MLLPLHEIADIITGLSTSGRSPVGKGRHTVRFINVSDIADGVISTDGLKEEAVEDLFKIKRYQVIPGDVIVTVRGAGFKTAIVPPELAGCLISANLVVIRLKPDAPMTPEVLRIYMESKAGWIEIDQRRQGSVITHLSTRDLAGLPIPIPDQSLQKKLIQLNQTSQAYFETAKRLLETQNRLVEEAIAQVFTKERVATQRS